MSSPMTIRPSPIAGQWYPGDPKRLAASVDQYISAAQLPAINGGIVAIMVPHAGHRYSGPVAGFAFNALKGLEIDIVAVISPMHYPYPAPLITTSHAAYETPLGLVEVDHKLLQSLEDELFAALGYGMTRVPNDPEHSLEIELPFLQRALDKPFRLLPVMVRDSSQKVTKALGKSLAHVLENQHALLIASTDLSHFYPQNIAQQLDGEMLRQVQAFSPDGVLQAEETGTGFACGRGALAAVMWAAQELGANHAQILHYATSGNVTGDFTQVVGYGAAIFTRIEENGINILD